jgi:hypothetical protein
MSVSIPPLRAISDAVLPVDPLPVDSITVAQPSAATARRIDPYAPRPSERPPVSPSVAPAGVRSSKRPSMPPDEHDSIAHTFFARPSRPPAADEGWDADLPHAPMASDARRAMLIALGVFGVSLVLILGYVAYHNWVMPAPVELGAGAIEAPLPMPIAAPLPESVSDDTATVQLTAPPPTPAALPSPPSDEARGTTAAASTLAPDAVSPSIASPSQEAPSQEAPFIEVSGGPSYDELLAAGTSLSKRGQRAAAIDAFQRALVQRPNASEALSRLAFLHLNEADPRRARELAEQAVASDPGNSEGWIVLGAAHDGLGDRAAALAAYRRCKSVGRGSYVRECERLAR